jgi:hypothetical protein
MITKKRLDLEANFESGKAVAKDIEVAFESLSDSHQVTVFTKSECSQIFDTTRTGAQVDSGKGHRSPKRGTFCCGTPQQPEGIW